MSTCKELYDIANYSLHHSSQLKGYVTTGQRISACAIIWA